MSGVLIPVNGVPATPDKGQQLGKQVAQSLGTLIFEPPGLFENRAGFVAGGGSDDPFANTVRTLTQLNCRLWNARDKSGFSADINAGNSNICSNYLASIGEFGDIGEVDQQFLGKQCPGAEFFVTVSVRYELVGAPGLFVTSGVTSRVTAPVGQITVRDGGFNQNLFVTIRANKVGGVDQPQGANPEGTVETVEIETGGQRSNGTGATVDGISFAFRSGSDDCGDPAPILRPPPTFRPTVPINPTINVDFPGFGDVQVNVDLDPDGRPIICLPQFDTCITVGVEGDGGGGGGGGGGSPAGGDGLPGDPTATNPPAFSGEPGAGGEEVDFGTPPEGKVWVGCLARYVVLQGVAAIPGSATANRAYTQVVGNLSLRYGGERGTARQVRSEWVEAFRPVTALEVTGAFVNSLPQAVVTIFPVAATICPEGTCGGGDG